jgi:PAS domain S-box-containing protein
VLLEVAGRRARAHAIKTVTSKLINPIGPAVLRIAGHWRTLVVLAVLALGCGIALLMPFAAKTRAAWFGEPITRLNDLRQIDAGNRVRLSGVVTFVSPEQGFYYLQDEIGGMRIYPQGSLPLPNVGDRLVLRATIKVAYDAAAGRKSVTLADDLRIEDSRRGTLPEADAQPLPDLFSDPGTREAIRVETSGIVRAAKRDGGRMLIEIADNGLRLPVAVEEGQTLSAQLLLDTRVTVRGVVQTDYNPWEEAVANNNELGPLLQVASRADIVITDRAPQDIPLAPSVRALITDPKWVAQGHRVRIHTEVIGAQSPRVLLTRNGGLVLPVETVTAQDYQPGDLIEAVGWPTPRRFTITLQRADVVAIPKAAAQIGDADDSALPVMTSIAAIRRMQSDVASRAYPVDLVGVITIVDPRSDHYFIQSGNEGIYVDASDQALAHVDVGSRVRLRGLTWAGGFAPVIIHPQLEMLGHTQLPAGEKVDPEIAPSGSYDSRWVQIEGVARPIQRTVWGYSFNLMTAIGPVAVTMVRSEDPDISQKLTDRRVRVRGAFATSFTSERVLTGYRMFVDSPRFIEIIDSQSDSHSSALPLREISNLLRFSGTDQSTRRARVRGVVTMRSVDYIYMQDDSGSLRVQSQDRAVTVGDVIDAIGYPSPTDNGPVLTDATIHRLDAHKPVQAQVVTPEDVLKGTLDNRLVSIEARLLNQVGTPTQQTLVLHDGHTTFNAVLDGRLNIGDLRDGSVLRVVGITDVQRQRSNIRVYASDPVSFRLLMRSLDDLQLVKAAPWWDMRRAWPVLSVLLLVVCVAALWVLALRRRVQAQTSEINGQRDFLRQVIDMCPNYIFVKDRAGRFTLANRAMAEAYGRTPEQMIGRTDTDIGIPEDEARAYFIDDHEVMDSRREKIVPEESCTDGRGQKRWMHTVKRPILDEHGVATRVLGVSNDVTLHKEAEATLLRAREAAEAANQAKSEFLANMSHEIRTPLNGILGMSELCLDTELTREQREYIETMKLSADGLLNVINDILDFSKIEAGRLEVDTMEFDVRETLEAALKVVALRAHQKGLELVSDIDVAVPPLLLGDGHRLRQVVLNLVGNAVKFTMEGEVVLRARVTGGDASHCNLQISVIDTGIGIPAERREQIFKPFVQADSSTTRQFGGTGLGLTISSRLIELMGGRVWVDSEPGRGSEFHFTLRLGRVQTAAAQDNAAAPLRGVRIMVVDDNASSRRALVETLSRWQMRVKEAPDAATAMTTLEAQARAGNPVTILLADMNMPGTDGATLVTQIRERDGLGVAGTVMLISAGQRDEISRCRHLGVSGYIPKPVRTSELRDTLLRMLSVSVVSNVASLRASAPAEEGSGLSILLAEDNAVNQLVMQRLLAKRGHRVVTAANGQAALDAMKRDAFDLIFMDVQMPLMDGFDATAEIRRREAGSSHRIPIVALTAHAMSGDRERCLRAGMDAYMTKPVNPVELDEMLKLFVHREYGAA